MCHMSFFNMNNSYDSHVSFSNRDKKGRRIFILWIKGDTLCLKKTMILILDSTFILKWQFISFLWPYLIMILHSNKTIPLYSQFIGTWICKNKLWPERKCYNETEGTVSDKRLTGYFWRPINGCYKNE
jgi:hypothetical protein